MPTPIKAYNDKDYNDYSEPKPYLKAVFFNQVAEPFFDAVNFPSPFTPRTFRDIIFNKYIVDDFAYHDDLYFYGVFKYFSEKVIPHKVAVLHAGMELLERSWYQGLKDQEKGEFIRNLWLHDISKFSANEAFGYAMYDFNNPAHNDANHPARKGFDAAWHHHKMNNPHHSEYWLNPNRMGILEPLPMPHIYLLEMLADWIGYESTLDKWLPANIHKFKFAHPHVVVRMLQDMEINVKATNLGESGTFIFMA